MAQHTVTAFSILGVTMISLIVVADIVLMKVKSSREATTWSELLRVGAWYSTAIPWALGVWVGHWFPIVQEPLFTYSYVIVLVVTLVWVALWDVLRIKFRITMPHIVTVAVGLVVGGLFWPLRHVN
jgi:hypothetical protein